MDYEALLEDLKIVQYQMQIVITELGENLKAGNTYLEEVCGLHKICEAQDIQLFFMQLECWGSKIDVDIMEQVNQANMCREAKFER